LVGSSRIRRCGASSVARSSDSRAFCPPDSFAHHRFRLRRHQAEARQPRAQLRRRLLGAFAAEVLSGVSSTCNSSTWCCAK
jgi:hypothetical protein